MRILRAVSLSLGVAMAAALGGCADDPGLGSGPAYEADLAACQQSASDIAGTIAKRRFYTFATYPISTLIIERNQLRDCMEQKGHPA